MYESGEKRRHGDMKRHREISRSVWAPAFRAALVVITLEAGTAAGGLGSPPASKLKKPERYEPKKAIGSKETPAGFHSIGLGQDLAALHAQAIAAANGTAMSPITDALIFLVMQLRIEAEEGARIKEEEKASAKRWSRRWYPPADPAAHAATTNRSP